MNQMPYQVFNKECNELKEIPDGSVDVVITSPPFNIEHIYFKEQDSLSHDAYLDMLRRLISTAFRKTKAGGYFVIDVSDYIFPDKHVWFASKFFDDECKKVGYTFNDFHLYLVSGREWFFTDGDYDKNGFLNSKNDHSPVITLMVFGKDSRFALKNNVLKKSYQYGNEENNAYWSDEMIDDFMVAFDLKGKVVLDPFMGSGRLGVQVINTGGFFYGYEKTKEGYELFLKNILR